MYNFLTKDNIQFSVYLFGILYIVYKNFRNPQIKFEQDIKLINQELLNLKNNHIHSLTEQQKITNKRLISLENEITRLATIIEERIPRK